LREVFLQRPDRRRTKARLDFLPADFTGVCNNDFCPGMYNDASFADNIPGSQEQTFLPIILCMPAVFFQSAPTMTQVMRVHQ
jgi:hypothetical protein